jgi:hypothetical protein
LPIEHIHTYLVHPGKGADDAPRIGGASVTLQGRLFDLLNEVYQRSAVECDIDISFNRSADGQQRNECRTLVLDYLGGPTLARGRHLAIRLERVTTHRSGLGLLFLISGREGRDHKIVISRFPADSAILAEEDQQNLNVEFLERVFMKSAASYKAAAYQDSSLVAGFWTGRATDKQINHPELRLSTYWIADFLDSDFRTTAAAGTRRLAVALREAAKKAPDIAVKSEIASAVTLAGGLAGRRISIADFERQFGLSDAARRAVAAEMRAPEVIGERFQFDFGEFSKHVAYRSVELDSGGILTAQSGDFEEVFHREVLDETDRIVRYSTEGRVISEKLGKSK